MKVKEAIPIIEKLLNKPFSVLDLADKGSAGKVLERLTGLNHSNKVTDFDDGELKTNDWYSDDKKSKETIKVRQFSSSNISELIGDDAKEFEKSETFKKLKNTLYVTTVRHLRCKVPLPRKDWYFGHLFHITFEEYPKLFEIFKSDYDFCCKTLKLYLKIYNKYPHIYPFHTISGKYLQMRTAGSKNKKTNGYTPISYGNIRVCNKPICFMLQTNFLRDVGIEKNIK